MTLKLYGITTTPYVRSTLLTIKALGIEFELIPVNTLAGEQFAPEFIKLNPLHTIPTIQDGDFVIWDSHAVNAYLAGKYGKDGSLCPKDYQKRAVIDQRLHFDSSIVIPRLIALLTSIFKGAKSVDKALADALSEGVTDEGHSEEEF